MEAPNAKSHPAESSSSSGPDTPPNVHLVEVRQLDGKETTGDPERPKHFGLFQNDKRVHQIEIHRRDEIEFVMPNGEAATLAFLTEKIAPGTPMKDRGPFDANPVNVRGQRKIASRVPSSGSVKAWKYPFVLYLTDRYHVVDGNSTPVIIVHDP